MYPELRLLLAEMQALREQTAVRMEPRFFTPIEAAQRLNIKLNTLYGLVSKGKIQAHKPGGKNMYFSVEQLEAYVFGTEPKRRGRPTKLKTDSSPKNQ